MTWTIPLVMSNLNNNPPNQYGLVGVVTLALAGNPLDDAEHGMEFERDGRQRLTTQSRGLLEAA